MFTDSSAMESSLGAVGLGIDGRYVCVCVCVRVCVRVRMYVCVRVRANAVLAGSFVMRSSLDVRAAMFGRAIQVH